ncbi:hypothetical protein Tco_0273026 [Tanacetum coccineum]
MKSHDVAFWKETINDEMDSIMGNNTWVLADSLSGTYLYHKTANFYGINSQFDYSSDGCEAAAAPKQWHQKFDEVILSNGYLVNQADKCVYSNFDETGKEVIICLYVEVMCLWHLTSSVDLSKEFCHQVSTPMDTSEKLMPNNGQVVSQLEYSRVIDYLHPDLGSTTTNVQPMGLLGTTHVIAKASSAQARHLKFCRRRSMGFSDDM